MKRVVKCEEETPEVCSDTASEDNFYALETKSGRAFFLLRADAKVGKGTGRNREEDQWHWVAIGLEKNRKTGYKTFEAAIEGAYKSEDNVLKEFDTQEEVYKYLAKRAKDSGS